MQKQIFIYANASELIGTGHIMRVMGLVQEAIKQGIKVTLLSHELLPYLKGKLLDEGCQCIQMKDRNFLSLQADAIIFDSYTLSKEEKASLDKLSMPSAFFDDQIDDDFVSANFIINTSSTAKAKDYEKRTSNPKFCLGPQYHPFRKDFISQKVNSSQDRLLISLGGSDPKNVTPLLVKKLLKEDKDLPLDIIFRRNLSSVGANIKHYKQIDAMAPLMAQAQLAITTASVTLQELMLLRIPSIALTLFDNQFAALNSPYKNKAFLAYDLREFSDLLLDQVIQKTLELWHSPFQRESMLPYMKDLLPDAMGAKRILEALEI